MKSSKNELGIIFTLFSDAFGRLRREVVDLVQGYTEHLHNTTLYDYDILGPLTRVVNPAGQETKYLYDNYGRVKYKRQPDLGILSYAYDKV
ncbi:MAG: hypothetical protein IPM69_00155 [Ignavibacteria bacterium]|nr:hypothetical protein [Ignavibacteria bacterium]